MIQQNKQGSKIGNELVDLINQQWSLVLRGKQGSKLAQLISSYQMDLRCPPIQNNLSLMQKYISTLLLNGQYLQLGFLVDRVQELPNKQKLAIIASAGSKQQLTTLGSVLTDYFTLVSEPLLKQRLRVASLHSILRILGKYFLNFAYIDLNAIFEATQGQIEQLGYCLQDGFIVLKHEKIQSDCLLTKLHQLALVAHKMSKLE